MTQKKGLIQKFTTLFKKTGERLKDEGGIAGWKVLMVSTYTAIIGGILLMATDHPVLAPIGTLVFLGGMILLFFPE